MKNCTLTFMRLLMMVMALVAMNGAQAGNTASAVVSITSNVSSTVPGTQGNDFFLPSGNNAYYGGAGNDTYIISPYTLSGAVTAKIIDTEGANVIQLIGGVTIASSSFFMDAVQLMLPNGVIVQVLGASKFIYQLGANAVTGETASNLSYAQFAATLGASLPTDSTPVSGTANYVIPTNAHVAATASTYFNDAQKLYIAFYQRPADSGGLLYWSQIILVKNGDVRPLVNALSTSAEATALYFGADGSGNIGDAIDKVYMTLFGRSADMFGKQYYSDGFAAGKFTFGSIVLDILNGAQNNDAVGIMNKVNGANLFTAAVDGRPMTDTGFGSGNSFSATYSGNADVTAARAWLATINSQPYSIKTASEVAAFVRNTIANAGDPINGTGIGVLNVP